MNNRSNHSWKKNNSFFSIESNKDGEIVVKEEAKKKDEMNFFGDSNGWDWEEPRKSV